MTDKRKRKPIDIEARIRKEYSKLRKEHRKVRHYDYSYTKGVTGNVLMKLARKWKKPMAEIKHIVNYKGAAERPIVYQTAEEHRLDVAHKKCEYLRNLWAWEDRYK